MTRKISEEKWKRRFLGLSDEDFYNECTMPGCHNKIFKEQEYYIDGEKNIFCSPECIFEWFGIRKV